MKKKEGENAYVRLAPTAVNSRSLTLIHSYRFHLATIGVACSFDSILLLFVRGISSHAISNKMTPLRDCEEAFRLQLEIQREARSCVKLWMVEEFRLDEKND